MSSWFGSRCICIHRNSRTSLHSGNPGTPSQIPARLEWHGAAPSNPQSRLHDLAARALKCCERVQQVLLRGGVPPSNSRSDISTQNSLICVHSGRDRNSTVQIVLLYPGGKRTPGTTTRWSPCSPCGPLATNDCGHFVLNRSSGSSNHWCILFLCWPTEGLPPTTLGLINIFLEIALPTTTAWLVASCRSLSMQLRRRSS